MSEEEIDWLLHEQDAASGPDDSVDKQSLRQLSVKQLRQEIEMRNKEDPIDYDFIVERQWKWKKRQICSFCDERKVGRIGMREHMKQRHSAQHKEWFRCHVCRLDAATAGYMVYHLSTKHSLVVTERAVKGQLIMTDLDGKCSPYNTPKATLIADNKSTSQSENTAAQKSSPGDVTDTQQSQEAAMELATSTDNGVENQGNKRRLSNSSSGAADDVTAAAADTAASDVIVVGAKKQKVEQQQPAKLSVKLQCVAGVKKECHQAFDRLHHVCMHSKQVHGGHVKFEYSGVDKHLIPAGNGPHEFFMPKVGWSVEVIGEFEREIRDRSLTPPQDAHKSLTVIIQQRLALVTEAKAAHAQEMDAKADTEFFTDQGADEKQMVRMREKRLKQRAIESGFEYDFVTKKKSGKGKVVCPAAACGQTMKSLVSLRNHCIRMHPAAAKLARTWVCHGCGKESHNVLVLSDHYNDVHNLKIPPILIQRILGKTNFDVIADPSSCTLIEDEAEQETGGAASFWADEAASDDAADD